MAKDSEIATRPAGRSLLAAIRDGDTRAAKDASIEELMALAQASAAELGTPDTVRDVREAGDGFIVVPRHVKELLVGVPFFIVDTDINPSRKVKGGYFGSIHIRTVRPVDAIRPGADAFIINDGGTGIFKQLEDYRATYGATKMLPMWCPKGLRVSRYEVTEDDPTGALDERTGKPRKVPVLDPKTNEPIQGETFYLDDTA